MDSGPTYADLTRRAAALDAAGRWDEALEMAVRAAPLARSRSVADRNIAILQLRLNHFEAAEQSARSSLAARDGDAETWATLARALLGQAQRSAATEAYAEAIRIDPTNAGAQRDFAQLMWVDYGDSARAVASVAEARGDAPENVDLALAHANILRQLDQEALAFETLSSFADAAGQPLSEVDTCLSQLALALGRDYDALAFAQRAVRAAPTSTVAILALVDCHFAFGRADRAARILEALHVKLPEAQEISARLATAWRILGDPRYHDFCDYGRMLTVETLEHPEGWPDRAAFFADVATAAAAAHDTHDHPFDQSLRRGTQTHSDLRRSSDPALQAFFKFVDAPILKALRWLGQGTDPLSRRNTGGYRFQSAWSTSLRTGGYHKDHVHRFGWLSAVCYLRLPDSSAQNDREGWLKLGQPGVRTMQLLDADQFVEPAIGRLVMFPSYMWHGTVPFSGISRLTIAFDILPDERQRSLPGATA